VKNDKDAIGNQTHDLPACTAALFKVPFSSIQINHQLDATVFQFIILMFIYCST
jgi:hypothetical protein